MAGLSGRRRDFFVPWVVNILYDCEIRVIVVLALYHGKIPVCMGDFQVSSTLRGVLSSLNILYIQ